MNSINMSYNLHKASENLCKKSVSYGCQSQVKFTGLNSSMVQSTNSVKESLNLLCGNSPVMNVDSNIGNHNIVGVASSSRDGNRYTQASFHHPTSPIVQLQLETVKRYSVDNSTAVEIMSGRDIQEVQETLSISDTGGNRGPSVVTQNIKTTLTASLSTKRKGNDYYKVKKNSTSLLPTTKRFCSSENPSGSSLVEASNYIIGENLIHESISVGASLQTQFDVLSNNVQHAECQSNSPVQLKSNHSHVQAKINDLEIVRMTNDETARKEYLSNFGITEETFCNNLPVIKDVWSETSISGAVDGTQDCSLVNSQSEIMGIPIITEVTSLASVLNQEDENVYGQQAGITDVYSNSIDKCHNTENGSSAFVNIMHGNRQNPNELGCPNTSLTEDGRELQITKVCQTMDTSRRVQFHITDKRQYGQNSNDKSNKAATKISDVISGHALQNVSFVNQELSSNSKSGIISTNTSACSVSTSMTQNNPVSSFPQISSCIDAWHKVFPWILYREMDHSFLCKVCEWGAAHTCPHIVFSLKAPSDVHFVAGYLRSHQETSFHKMIESRKSLVVTLFKKLYPILRESFYKGLDDLISSIIKHNEGCFPGPQTSPHKEYFTSFMIKRIAEHIEMSLLESLAKSPFFSVIAAEDKNFAILRWLNLKGEPEEHFFCSDIFYPGEKMTITVYLQSRNVDLTKLISYSKFPSKIVTPSSAKKSQLPIRYPPFSLLMKWLEKVDLLKEVFPHLETLTRLCKSSNFMVINFPEAVELIKELVKVEKPFSHGCLVNEKIIRLYFLYINELNKMCTDLYIKTGNMDAHRFIELQVKNIDSVQKCVSLLPKLHELFTKEDCSYLELYASSKKLRSDICAKMRSFENSDSDEHVVLSLFDMYLSHVITSLHTPEQEFAEIFTRKLRQLTVNDLGKILTHLNNNYEGGSVKCLHSLQTLCLHLCKNKNCSIYELLECFAKEPELCKAFPGLFYIYQKIKVLPFLHADTGQYMFNLAVLEMLSSNKDYKSIVQYPFLILLEGPPVEDINLDFVLEVWSNKWKMYYEKGRIK